jgi:lipopolysaccharide/colanic/teichoic acid biosynthesis glycosyltransferase
MLYRRYIKRAFDLVFSLIILVVLFPFGLPLLIILLINNKGSVFFIQTRPGLNGKLFRFTKLKTMNDKRGESGKLLPDNLRLSPYGRFIRSISFDELPQLVHVLIGDMSLVGPRPLLPDYLELYSEFQSRRHEVLPGITGWAQVNGRNSLSWEQKFEMDVWYVDNFSFMLDMKILLLTLMRVVKREGINSSSTSTMARFLGTHQS